MKNIIKFFGVIALLVIIGFSMAACDDGSKDDGKGGVGTGINAPGVGQVPAFPASSTPAATQADAEAILAELRQSTVLESLEEEIWEVIVENIPDNNNGNYSFSNRSLSNGYVKVSYSSTENETNTGGFKALSDLWKADNDLWRAINDLWDDYNNNWEEIERLEEERNRLYEQRYDIQFARNNKMNGTSTGNSKGEVTRAKTESGVTIAQGSTFEGQETGSYSATVTAAGSYKTFRVNETESGKGQEVRAFTVTTSGGSVKVIFDASYEGIYSGNNVRYYWDDDDDDDVGTYTETEKYSGSLKVYGASNALLIDHRIVDWESYRLAYYMISYDPHPFNPVNVTSLTDNTIVNGNITSSGTGDWYSINVSNGTKYHLWWDDSDTNGDHMDVRVKGYTSDGYEFFDVDMGDEDSEGRSNYYSFTASSPGTVYIMVYPYSEYDTGTYAIVFNTTGTQPSSMRSVSSSAPVSPFGAASARPENKTEAAARLKKLGEPRRYNRKGFLLK